MPSSVVVGLSDNRLRVHFGARPELADAQGRLLFLNILGFSLDELGSAYMSPNIATPSLLKEVMEFFENEGIPVELSADIEQLLHDHDLDANLLQAAIQRGSQLHASPAREFQAPGLIRPLKPYQVPAAEHMVEVSHAANFSVPGAGKTTITLAAFAKLRGQQVVEALLVIGPNSSFMSWEDEWMASLGQKPKMVRITGARNLRYRLYEEARDAELVLVGYHMLGVDTEELGSLLKHRKTMMVLDESHHVKRMEGGLWATAAVALGELASRRVILSGTPVPNGMEDLWSQMTFLWPRPPVLGTVDDYKQRLKQGGAAEVEQIRESVGPLFWRIRKSELGLPPPTFHRVDVEMRPYQAAIYRVLAAKVLSDVVAQPKDRARLRIWRRARVTRLLQVATNPSLVAEYSPEFRIPPLDASGLSVEELIGKYSEFETPAKMSAAVELVRQLVAKRQKVIVWTSFVHNIRTLERALSELRPRLVYGAIPKDENEDELLNREKMIRQFKLDGEFPVLIANPAACAESLSLHAVCKHAVYLDRTFNAAHYLQSLDRIHRIGMPPRTKVHYYILKATQTIDEVIDERLEKKGKALSKLLEGDLQVVNLDYSEEEFSEEDYDDLDFEAVVQHVKKIVHPSKNDRKAGRA